MLIEKYCKKREGIKKINKYLKFCTFTGLSGSVITFLDESGLVFRSDNAFLIR